MHESKNALEIDSFWEYSDPAASEIRFRELLDSVHGDEALEVRTQIARTLGLRQRFEEGHETLNEVERELEGSPLSRARIRCVLERGRLFNSAGDRERARTLFIEAWEQARAAKQEGLAVDAAHMVAITDAGTEEALEWIDNPHDPDTKRERLMRAPPEQVFWLVMAQLLERSCTERSEPFSMRT